MTDIQILNFYKFPQYQIEMFISHFHNNLSFSKIAKIHSCSRQRVGYICSKLNKVVQNHLLRNVDDSSSQAISISNLTLKERSFNALVNANVLFVPKFNTLISNPNYLLSIKGINAAGALDILKAVWFYEQNL